MDADRDSSDGALSFESAIDLIPQRKNGPRRHVTAKDRVIRRFARAMRHASTDAEGKLWKIVRDRRFSGFKFRRQVPIGSYIADFVCFERRLIVEADGS